MKKKKKSCFSEKLYDFYLLIVTSDPHGHFYAMTFNFNFLL